eukprot:COSAG04_NODE_8_length_44311_cov_99.067531_13_plen_43_part_00
MKSSAASFCGEPTIARRGRTASREAQLVEAAIRHSSVVQSRK